MPLSPSDLADLPGLCDLPVLSLVVTARAREQVHLPAFSGSSLRGAFGTALYDLVCVHRDRSECAGCPLEPACTYPALFAPRAATDQPGASGFADLPRPYVFRPRMGEQVLVPGAPLEWRVTLIGRAIPHLPYFVLAWKAMGDRGVGRARGKFDFLAVDSLDPEGAVIQRLYDRETNRLQAPDRVIEASDLRPCDNAAALEIRFITPTLLKHAGREATVPEFHLLWRALQRRLSTLRMAHGAGRVEMDFAAAIRLAEAVRLESWESREITWHRYSRRQDQRIPMGGFVGRAVYAGELGPFLPALRLGALVGVGDNCVFGQGEYVLPEPTRRAAEAQSARSEMSAE